MEKITNISFRDNEFLQELQSDNIYVESKVVNLSELTGMPVRKRKAKAIIVDGMIVNTVSDQYGHLPNEKFFYEVERKLMSAGIDYVTRSINRENVNFAVDYILRDESYHINVKNGMDSILPMMRFTNSYEGRATSGSFGFFRPICANGLHVANTKIGFKVWHTSDITKVVMPEIGGLVEKFINNEFFSLHKKFEVLAETSVDGTADFVRYTASKMNLFKYEKSEKNPEPSKNAQLVIDIMNRESNILGTKPNLWLGYNAFNEYLHSGNTHFGKQRQMDNELFNTVLQLS